MLRCLSVLVLVLGGAVVASEWSIQLEQGYPTIAFSDSTDQGEILFDYAFGGNVSYLSVALKQFDCMQPKDNGLKFVKNTTNDNLFVGVDVVESTITNSVHYTPLNETTASVNFCVRINYVVENGQNSSESIQLSETPVSITVDLTANFTLSSVTLIRDAADEALASAKVDYSLQAYFCADGNVKESKPPPLSQGSTLEVCVRVDPSVTTDVFVEDVLVFVVSQPSTSVTIKSVAIVDGQPDILTTKVCTEDGVCNIKTNIPSKFFTEQQDSVRVDGVALLSFGSTTTQAPTSVGSGRRQNEERRFLRVPLGDVIDLRQLDHSKRSLENDEKILFGLEVPLSSQVTEDDSATQDPEQDAPGSHNILVLVSVGVLGLSLIGCFVNAALAYHRRLQKDHDQDELDDCREGSKANDRALSTGLEGFDNCAITVGPPKNNIASDIDSSYRDIKVEPEYAIDEVDVDDCSATVLTVESPSYKSRTSREPESHYLVDEGPEYQLHEEEDDDILIIREKPTLPSKAIECNLAGKVEQ